MPGGINPLMKGTGFERLKKYLASQTGIYNTFDLNSNLFLYNSPDLPQKSGIVKTPKTASSSIAVNVVNQLNNFNDTIDISAFVISLITLQLYLSFNKSIFCLGKVILGNLYIFLSCTSIS